MNKNNSNPKIEKEIEELPHILHKRMLERYFKYVIQESESWQYFNPKHRNWEFLKLAKELSEEHNYFLILRNGWVIRKLERKGSNYYYLCENNNLITITEEIAGITGYEYSFGIFFLPAIIKEEYIFLHIRDFYFPSRFFNVLRTLSYKEEKGSDDFYTTFVFKEEDKKRLEHIMYKLRIRLQYQTEFITENKKEKSAMQIGDIKKLLSDILTSIYSNYLKTETQIEELELILLNKEWESIKDEQLRENLNQLAELEAQGDMIAKKVLHFLTEKIIIYFDWKYYFDSILSPNLEGLIIKATPLTFSEKWANNYYKVIFPVLETTLFWQTTISPTRLGIGEFNTLSSRFKKVSISKWRIYPYLGKLKNTGTRDDIEFTESDQNFIKKSLYSIIGIPSLEFILSKDGYVDSFNLDLEVWKGAYTLDRYFLAIVKVMEPLEYEAPTPRTKVIDIFGNGFSIEWDFNTYLYCLEDIHSIEKGGWISILLQNVFGEYESDDIPKFRTAHTISPRFVKKEEAYRHNITALIKYCGFLSKEHIKKFFHKTIYEVDLQYVIEELINEGTLYEENGVVYYVYKCLTNKEMADLVGIMNDPIKIPAKSMFRDKWYLTWSLIREHTSQVHPLIYSEHLFKDLNIQKNEVETNTFFKKISK